MRGQKHLKKYFSTVSKMMPRDYPEYSQLLTDIKHMLSEYVDLHPNATYDELVRVHGTPEELITSWMDDLSSEEVLLLFRKRQRRSAAVIAISIGIAIFIAIGMIRANEPHEPLDIMESTDPHPAEEVNLYKGDY